MAEFLPTPPEDPAEAAYRRALLNDDEGRDARRARLMAALPRPVSAPTLPVARSELAWRWQPHGLLGLLALGLLVAAVLAWRGRPVAPQIEPRLASAERASGAAAVAAAAPAAVVAPPVPPVAAARVPASQAPAKPRAVAQPPEAAERPRVLADAGLHDQRSPTLAVTPAAPEPALTAEGPRPVAPAVVAAAPPAPDLAAGARASPKLAEAAVPSMSGPAENVARADAAMPMSAARARMPLPNAERAASAAMPSAALMLAVGRADLGAARAALQQGAWVHERDPQGRTLLMLAARSGSGEMVQLLLAAGARKDDRDPRGWNAADHARDAGHEVLAGSLH